MRLNNHFRWRSYIHRALYDSNKLYGKNLSSDLLFIIEIIIQSVDVGLAAENDENNATVQNHK